MMKKLLYLTALGLMLFACKKDNSEAMISGNYTGTFRRMTNGKMVISDFDVSLQAKQFKVNKGDIKGSGTYQANQAGQLVFTDQNTWPANFNWNLILSGIYTTETKGDSLILTRYFPPSVSSFIPYYQYRLKKTN